MSREPRDFVMTPVLRDLLRKEPSGHKYTHGHAVVLSGGAGRTGAARLAARAALRAGAGLVTLAVPEEAAVEVACQITAVMMRPVTDAAALTAMIEDHRLNAICVGPGLGMETRESGLVAAVLAGTRATVLDADALSLVGRDERLQAMLHPACILTPHDGEFARIFPDLAAQMRGQKTDTAPERFALRVQAARAAARQAGCTILLKGPDTIVAEADGRCWVHKPTPDGALAWLATAGTGDVLAGIIAGLLARGMKPPLAANMAICLHGLAARRFGPGLIAEDLPDLLPGVFADLGV
ncbi:MAG: NAD(P)H-hydrate dehydratase [Rhodobacterales bacterium]